MQKPPLNTEEKLNAHLQELEVHIQNQFSEAQKIVLSKTIELPERLKAARFIWLITRKPEDKRRMIELIMEFELR